MSRRNSIGSEIRVRAAAPGFTRSFTVRRMKNAASAGRMPIAKSQRQAMSSGRALNDQVGGVGERPADRVRALQNPHRSPAVGRDGVLRQQRRAHGPLRPEGEPLEDAPQQKRVS
jgi:hypothetical protein